MDFSLYKVILIAVVTVLSGILAIRIKGKIILLWLFVLFRYNLRPKLYLFNKRVCSYREYYPEPPKEPMPKAVKAKLGAAVELVKL